MLASILLTVQILIALAMGGLILLQRSEGGALGIGGGPTGLVSARGAGNLLTRATSILAVLFFVNSLLLTVVFAQAKKNVSAVDQVDTKALIKSQAPSTAPSGAAPADVAIADQFAPKKPSLSDLPLASAPAAPRPVTNPETSAEATSSQAQTSQAKPKP
jgi:preprotein translocase subunit SecG